MLTRSKMPNAMLIVGSFLETISMAPLSDMLSIDFWYRDFEDAKAHRQWVHRSMGSDQQCGTSIMGGLFGS